MKVTFVLPQLVYGSEGGLVGGYVNSAVNVMEALQSQCQIVLIAGVHHASGKVHDELSRRLNAVELKALPMSSAPGTNRYLAELSWQALAACARDRRADEALIYGHSGHPGYSTLSKLLAVRTTARSIHCLYCPVRSEFQHKAVGRTASWISSQGLRRVDSAVAISQNVAESISLLTKDKVTATVIPPAISTQPSLFLAQRTQKFAGETVIGFVGHHRPEKGLDLALQAFRGLHKDFPLARLLVLASGAESQGDGQVELKSLIEDHGLSGHVNVIYGIKDMSDFYSSIDVMLIPFRNTRGPSDFPMVLLEALAVGVPVVCTPVGAVPEVIISGWNGYLAADAQPISIMRALHDALKATSQETDLMRMRAAESSSRFYSQKVASATTEHFDRVLGGP